MYFYDYQFAVINQSIESLQELRQKSIEKSLEMPSQIFFGGDEGNAKATGNVIEQIFRGMEYSAKIKKLRESLIKLEKHTIDKMHEEFGGNNGLILEDLYFQLKDSSYNHNLFDKWFQEQYIKTKYDQGYTPEDISNLDGKDIEIIKLILDNDGEFSSEIEAANWFIKSCDAGRLYSVKFLINRGINPNSRDREGKTALHEVCESNDGPINLAIAKLLLESGADPTIKDYKGNSPFAEANSSFNRRYGKKPANLKLVELLTSHEFERIKNKKELLPNLELKDLENTFWKVSWKHNFNNKDVTFYIKLRKGGVVQASSHPKKNGFKNYHKPVTWAFLIIHSNKLFPNIPKSNVQ